MQEDKTAIQLYTLRDLTARDMVGTLGQLAAAGFTAVEFAGFGNATVAEVRAALDAHGMRGVAAHISLNDLETRFDGVLADMHALGCRYVVVPSIPRERCANADQVREVGALLNRYAALCRTDNLRFAYHNHNFEFTPLDGTTMYELLLETTDPEQVGLELDVYWLQRAGVDPVAMIQRLAGRVPLLHVKDMAGDAAQADLPVGEGVLPWPTILAAAATAGVEWYIIEQDHPQDSLPDSTRALTNLRRLLAPG